MKHTIRFALLSVILIAFSLAIGPAGAQEAPASPEVGVCLPGAGYAPGCDVDQDGDIDVVDLQRTAGRWNSSGVYTTSHSHWGEIWADGSGNHGLRLEHTATGGSVSGIVGQSASFSGTGVLGVATSLDGDTVGVQGLSNSPTGIGVYGWANASSGSSTGVFGTSNSPTGYAGRFLGQGQDALYVVNTASGRAMQAYAPNDSAIWARTDNGLAAVNGWNSSPTGRGLSGLASSSTGPNYGVWGQSASNSGAGVLGMATSASGGTTGVYGESASTNGAGVLGIATATSGETTGVYGGSASASGRGVLGTATASSGEATGVYGASTSTSGRGVFGYASAASGTTYGVRGDSASTTGYGVYGNANATSGVNYGVYGTTSSAAGYAGYFAGRVEVTGNLSKGGGSFKIDHPLDPANQYLYHSFVESPDMMNIYNGNAMLDEKGEAWVELPAWFEALNRDFRYQLTPIGGWAPLYVAQKVQGNRFEIAGGEPGMEVSWQVTGIRHDAYAEAHRIPVEEPKPAAERGLYLHPTELGQLAELGLDYQRRAARPDALQAARLAAVEEELP